MMGGNIQPIEWQESELPLPLVSSLPFTVLNSNNNPIDTGTDNPEVAQRLETQPNEACFVILL